MNFFKFVFTSDECPIPLTCEEHEYISLLWYDEITGSGCPFLECACSPGYSYDKNHDCIGEILRFH